MKFKITMKDPDGVYESVRYALPVEERTSENISQVITEDLRQWFESGEYLTVEVDTEARTCVVTR